MRTKVIDSTKPDIFSSAVDKFCNRNIVVDKHFFVLGGGAYPLQFVVVLRYLTKREIRGDDGEAGS